MASTDPVRIVIELVDRVSSELKKIEKQLDRIDNQRIDPDFNIDGDEEEFSRIKAQMRMMERRMSADWNVNIDEKDIAQVMAIRGGLGRDIASQIGGRTLGKGGFVDVPLGGAATDLGGISGRRGDGPDIINTFNTVFGRLGKTLNKYKPSIMDWWQLVAVLIPVMITLGAAVIGVVGALGALATASVAILGLGLIGWGDTFAESMQHAKQELGELKREMFAAMQPSANVMGPTAMRFIDALPRAFADLNDELRGLVAFERGIAGAGAGLIDWTEEAISSMNALRGEALQVSHRIGQAFGSFTIELVEFGLGELFSNQESYIKLAEAFVEIIAIIFNLSRVVAFVLAQFEPLLTIIVALTGVMSNKWTVAIITLITALGGLAFVLGNVMAAMLGLTNLGILSFVWSAIAGIAQLTGQLWAMFMALNAVQKATAAILFTTGVGAAFALAGTALSSTGGGPDAGVAGTRFSGGGGNTYNSVTIQGDVGDKEMHRLLDHLETTG